MPQHHRISKASLLFLLAYAMTHPHSAQWIGAIRLLLSKGVRP
jgi:hypothetical protein